MVVTNGETAAESLLKIFYKDPDDHTFLPVLMWFYVEIYLRRKAQLIAGGYMKGSRDKDD